MPARARTDTERAGESLTEAQDTDGHSFTQEPRSELPVETVYAAVREYVTTGQRPACVQWTNAPEL
ncbi:Imm1 family immunity protein [Saccharomonospora sp. NPDC006951]